MDYSHVRQLFDGVDCPPDGCQVLTGTAVVIAGHAVVTEVDFDLIEKGVMTGLVIDANTMLGIEAVTVRLFDGTGSSVRSVSTDVSGQYVVEELDAGTYFVATDDFDYVNELYDGLACPVGCDPTTGTPVVVLNDTTTAGIDFSIVAKGRITGAVTADPGGDPITMRVYLYDHLGIELDSEFSYDGTYEFTGLDDGVYHVGAYSSSAYHPYLGELYDDIPCWGGPPSGCTVTDGAPVPAAAATVTAGIDFVLLRSGSIAGTVVDVSSGAPVTSVSVHVLDVAGPGVWSDYLYPGSGEYLVDGLPQLLALRRQ